MHDPLLQIELLKPELIRICQSYSVATLWIFGSAVTKEWDPISSDIDLAVEFGPVPINMKAIEQFFGFQRSLEGLFGRKIDLIEWGSDTNQFFRKEVERCRMELYAA